MLKMTEKHTTWPKDYISYEGNPNQKEELKILMEELPLTGLTPITVSFSKKRDLIRVLIKPKQDIDGIACIFKEGSFDFDSDSPLHFMSYERNADYIELGYKNYTLWIQLFGDSKQGSKN